MTDLDPWTTVTADGGDQTAEDQDPRMSEVDFSHPRESGQHCFTSYWLENGKHPPPLSQDCCHIELAGEGRHCCRRTALINLQ